MGVTVKIEGLRDLERELAKLPKSTGKAALRRVLKKAATPLAEDMRSRAPTGDTATDDLADSIAVSTKLSTRQARLHRRMFRNDRAAVEMFVGPGPLPQAVYAEFGTAPHINKGRYAGTQHPGTAPQPFVRPAWDAQRGPMLARLRADLWAEIRKTVKRAEARAAKAKR
ncbi:HK97-gp10 family putative phage morphogenesis protein [Limimaricola variabilis]|uniref:HK97-gp10 family putative phage morphogenesis protein n=1 Tax=Limimaricola variabilis TaxID=1492771 RepID=UPI002AC9A41D|nr:HK97-gp10 family putative phage morphogenesis protein [Limimaricola variabilis]WPY93160.1 HK97-gp10 family putative phage morphogenesis protein [Limimaricola variabilis]